MENLSSVSTGINDIAETPNTDLERGIPPGHLDEQDQCHRPTLLGEAPPPGFVKLILKTFNNWIIALLFVYAVLSLGFGIIMRPPNGWHEGFIMILVIIMIIAIESIKKHWLERSPKTSRKQKPLEMQQMKFDIVREGCQQQVSISDVLPDDEVYLQTGSLVPADGLFKSSTGSLVPADGLFPSTELLQVNDGSVSNSNIDKNNRDLTYGTKVINGTGWMKVTSVRMDTKLGDSLNRVSDGCLSKTPAQLDRLNTATQIAGLLLSVLNLLVLFVRFKVEKESFDLSFPELKGKLIGKYVTYSNSICTTLIGLTEGIPFVIAFANRYWNKMASTDANVQEPLALLTMGSVTTGCIDITGCPAVDDVDWGTTGREIKALKDAGVNIVFVSEDNESGLVDIARQCGLLPDHIPEVDRLILQGEDFRLYTDKERMNVVEKIVLMGRSSPSDKLLLVQCLKNKGQVVAMVGNKINEIPALKEANVAISINSNSELVRESSDVINVNGNLTMSGTEWKSYHVSFLVPFVRYGRCIYDNIGKYMQLELTMNVAGLLIMSIITMSYGYSPITGIHFCWANFVVTIFGGVALLTEPPKERLGKTKPLIPEAIWRNILTQILYQVVSVTCLFIGLTMRGISKDSSKTIMFNVFVLSQVCNLLNSRQGEKKNVFEQIHRNPLFLLAVGVILVLQVLLLRLHMFL